MNKWPLILIAVLAITAAAFGQMEGSVSGTVFDADNNPVDQAMVRITEAGWHGGGGHGGGHNCGGNYSTFTADDGTFLIEDVPAGEYTAFASKMGFGHDSEEIEVTADENTIVDFILDMDGHGGGHHGDSLQIVELSGWAIVEADSFYTHYFLDTDNDGTADYRLGFGPAWYDPGNGAQRPEDGDSIWVVGGLMGYSEPQMVVVYEINGLFWREPGMGHGGYGGHGGDCDPDSLELIETSGFAILEEMQGHEDWFMYYLDEDNDGEADYHLNFGAPWYDPGNGATRPDEGDSVDIVAVGLKGLG